LSRSRRIPLIAVSSCVVLILIVLGVVFIPILTSGKTVGQSLEELQGQTHTTHYSDAAGTPAKYAPTWLPASATDVTLEIPGPNSKGPGGVQLDADVPASFALPTNCKPSGQNFPWAGGWSSLNIPTASLELCSGWTTTVANNHLYAWKL
jgi:hypothetical protein